MSDVRCARCGYLRDGACCTCALTADRDAWREKYEELDTVARCNGGQITEAFLRRKVDKYKQRAERAEALVTEAVVIVEQLDMFGMALGDAGALKSWLERARSASGEEKK